MTYRPSEKEISEADLFIIEMWLKQIRTSPARQKGREQVLPSPVQKKS